jgi:hypothetical protein
MFYEVQRVLIIFMDWYLMDLVRSFLIVREHLS